MTTVTFVHAPRVNEDSYAATRQYHVQGLRIVSTLICAGWTIRMYESLKIKVLQCQERSICHSSILCESAIISIGNSKKVF